MKIINRKKKTPKTPHIKKKKKKIKLTTHQIKNTKVFIKINFTLTQLLKKEEKKKHTWNNNANKLM